VSRAWRLLPLGALTVALFWAASAGATTFLPPSIAFQVAASRVSPSEVVVYFRPAPGYVIYKRRVSVRSVTPGIEIRVSLPRGVWHSLPAVAPQEVYLTSTPVTATVLGARSRPFTLEVRLQGCALAGLCYPPETRLLVVPAAS